MNDNYSIRLDKNHIPIDPKVKIDSQDHYDSHIQLLLYLRNQIDLGFNPNYMITYHLKHPAESWRQLKETNNTLGYKDRIGFTTYGSLWNQVPRDKYYERRRNDEFDTSVDNGIVKNLILKYLYGIKRPNQTWKYDIPPMLFVMEKGKVKLQYHIHLLLPKDGLIVDSVDDVADILTTSVRPRARCISRWKRIDVKELDDPTKATDYLTKETNYKCCSLDFMTSNLLKQTYEDRTNYNYIP
jgi:hypothetical protein